MDPVARSSAWRKDKSFPTYYDDMVRFIKQTLELNLFKIFIGNVLRRRRNTVVAKW